MKVYTVDINLTPSKIERFYAGDAKQVWARDVNGVSLRFPLDVLRPFVAHTGIHGRFRLTVNDDHRLTDVVRLS